MEKAETGTIDWGVVARTLRDAYAIMEQRGMAKYTREDAAGRVCAYGALEAVTTGEAKNGNVVDHPVTILAANLASDLASELYPDWPSRYGTIADFNNHSATTLDDMRVVFEKAAIRAEEMI